MVLFQPDYISRLIELGESDAEARADEINAFIQDETASAEAEKSDPTT